jgi:hypothetical protein
VSCGAVLQCLLQDPEDPHEFEASRETAALLMALFTLRPLRQRLRQPARVRMLVRALVRLQQLQGPTASAAFFTRSMQEVLAKGGEAAIEELRDTLVPHGGMVGWLLGWRAYPVLRAVAVRAPTDVLPGLLEDEEGGELDAVVADALRDEAFATECVDQHLPLLLKWVGRAAQRSSLTGEGRGRGVMPALGTLIHMPLF